MEVGCAGCRCVVDRGIRVATCEEAACCCADLPVRGEDAVRPESRGRGWSREQIYDRPVGKWR